MTQPLRSAYFLLLTTLASFQGLAQTRSTIQVSPNVTVAAGQSTPLRVAPATRAALQFDGVGDQLAIMEPGTTTPALLPAITNNFTVEAWVSPAASHEIDPQQTDGVNGVYNQHYLLFPTNGDDKFGSGHAGMGISVGTNGVSVYEHAGAYMPPLLVWQGTISGWTHLAVVYRDRTPALYINGELKATGLQSTKDYIHPSLVFGGDVYGYFQGQAAELRIWQEARSAASIQQQYNKELLCPEATLVGYWQLNEAAGTVAHDAKAGQRPGQLTRGKIWTRAGWSPNAFVDAPAGPGPQWVSPAAVPLTSALTYAWSPATGLDQTTGPGVNARPTTTTTYTVTATPPCGPPTTGQVTVTVNALGIVAGPSTDLNRNWTVERSFDGDGNIVAESKQYTDALGRPTQAQAHNSATKQVFAAQTIYSTGGQPVVQTMAAPINSEVFAYQENFVTVGGQPYGPANFEDAKASAPDAVDATTPGTLGYYYSKLNDQEPLTPATGYPYSLTEPYDGPMGGTRRSAAPGDELRMGKGREAKGRDFLVRREFDAYLQLRPQYVPGSPTGSLEYQAIKSVSINADGRESIVVSNKDGQALISCLSGPQYTGVDVYGHISSQPTNPFDPNAPAYQDVHIPAAGPQEVKFTMGASYTAGGRVLVRNLLTNDTTSYAIHAASPGVEPERRITLEPGFYRFTSVTGAQLFSYEAHYGNFSYTYYDDAGRVVATIAPNGFVPVPGPSPSLKNADFEIPTPTSTSRAAFWETDGDAQALYTDDYGGGHSGKYHGTHYSSSNSAFYALTHQTLTNLPNGRYTLRAWVKGTANGSISRLLVRNFGGPLRSVPIPYTPGGSFGPWTQLEIPNIQVTNGQCDVGFESNAGNTYYFIYFDDVELVRQSDPGSNFVTRNTYDTSSRLLATESSDEGRSEYVYARDGRIRFSQSALQRKLGRFSYSNYDDVGRVVESGEYTPGNLTFENQLTATPTATNVLQADVLEERWPANSLDVSQCTQRNQVWYDLPWDGTLTNPDGSVDATHQNSQLNGRVQEFGIGAVTKTKNDNVTTWYSYDELGRVTWVVQDIVGMGVKTLDYAYDFSGNVLEVAYQKGQPDSFYHYYSYDAAQRLTSVYTSANGTARTLQAAYSYYLHGPLKRVQVAGDLQGVDYVYTLQGALKSINHATAALEPGHDAPQVNGVYKDLFALTLEYFNGDYRSRNLDVTAPALPGASGTSRYDGTIQAAAWRTGSSADIQRMAYTYDEKSQLQNSTYSNWKLTGSLHQLNAALNMAFQEGGMRYDANGNILSLRRTNQVGAVTDDFTYKYKDNTNQLKSVHSGGAAAATLDYDYDELGQMTRQRDEQGQRYFTYDVSGKTTGVYTDADHTQPVVTFAYDDRGFRVSKTAYKNSVAAQATYYVRDVAGNILTVYNQPAPAATVQRAEVPLYGASRLGSLTHLDDGTAKGLDDYRYELNDHLGDARVVFHRPTTTVDVETMELSGVPSRAAFLNDDRYRVAVSSAPSGDYVARLTDSQPAGQELKRVLSVSKGDTITFSALAQWKQNAAAGGNSTTPFILAGAAAGLAPLSQRGPEGQTAYQTNSPNWLSLLAAGLGFTLGGGNQSASLGSTSLTGWIKYRVLDANGNEQASGRDYLLGTGKWEYLQTGVRIEQDGTIEVMAGTSGVGEAVYFDNLRVEQTGGLIVQEQHQYAFGAPLPGLSYVVGNKRYRHGYQGQYAEHDEETGFESFELRLYNSRVGRWLSYDPEGQYSSPYVGMGNNPVSRVDPNGGWSSLASIGVGAGIGAIAGGIAGYRDGGSSGAFAGAFLGAIGGGIAGGFAHWGIQQIPNLSLAVGETVKFVGGNLTVKGFSKLNLFIKFKEKAKSEIDLSDLAPGLSIPSMAIPERTIHSGGVVIDLGFNPSTVSSSNFRWFQTVVTNEPLDMQKANVARVDNTAGSPLPFYWTDNEEAEYSDVDGYNRNFHDDPKRPFEDSNRPVGLKPTFRAELSLVEITSSGAYKPVITMKYGYRIIGQQVKVFNLKLKKPSKTHLRLLNNY